jgi:hypothetical protein
VASTASDTVLRAHATEELASHLADPAALPESRAMLDAVRGNLEHEEAAVRLAALRALLASRRPLGAEWIELLRKLEKDDDDRVRRYATRLIKRRTTSAD